MRLSTPHEDGQDVALEALAIERSRQIHKWGQQDHDDGRWLMILIEEVGEASKAMLEGDNAGVTDEITQIMAVAFAWRAAIERRGKDDE